MLKRKQIIDLTIEENEFGGIGYGYFEGIKVKVKNAIKGQKLKVFINKVKNNNAEGKIYEIVEKSPLEDQVACPHFGNCGGCFYQSIAYEIQTKMKEEQVKRLFDEAGTKNYEYLSIEPNPNVYEYRNKMEFSFGDEEKGGPLTLGIHKEENTMTL